MRGQMIRSFSHSLPVARACMLVVFVLIVAGNPALAASLGEPAEDKQTDTTATTLLPPWLPPEQCSTQVPLVAKPRLPPLVHRRCLPAGMCRACANLPAKLFRSF